MSRNHGVSTVLTKTEEVPLFYNDHPVVDQPFTLEMGESVQRGDLVYVVATGWDADPAELTPDEGNTGDGAFTLNNVTAFRLEHDEETFTFTYDGTNWDLTGSESGAIQSDVAIADGGFTAWTNANGAFLYTTLNFGGTAFAAGDTFSITIRKTGSGGAYKATQQSHVTNTDNVVLIAGRDTDATDGPEPSFGYVRGVFNRNAIGNWDALVTSAGEEWEMIGSLQKVGIDVKEGLK